MASPIPRAAPVTIATGAFGEAGMILFPR